MKGLLRLWVLIAVIGGLPFLALLGIGGWWLWQQQLLLAWLSLSASCAGVAWISARLLSRKRKKSQEAGLSNPPLPLSQCDQQAWQAVEALIAEMKQEAGLNFEQLDTWINLGRRILQVVARHYRPDAGHPELDIPATELLGIVEKVSHDLHQELLSNLPFSHLITLADGLKLRRWLSHLQDANTLLRLSRMALNPLSGLLSEIKAYGQDRAVALTLPQ